jgi:hypothetical protein
MDERYFQGSANSSSVGLKTGAQGNRNIPPEDSTGSQVVCDVVFSGHCESKLTLAVSSGEKEKCTLDGTHLLVACGLSGKRSSWNVVVT